MAHQVEIWFPTINPPFGAGYTAGRLPSGLKQKKSWSKKKGAVPDERDANNEARYSGGFRHLLKGLVWLGGGGGIDKRTSIDHLSVNRGNLAMAEDISPPTKDEVGAPFHQLAMPSAKTTIIKEDRPPSMIRFRRKKRRGSRNSKKEQRGDCPEKANEDAATDKPMAVDSNHTTGLKASSSSSWLSIDASNNVYSAAADDVSSISSASALNRLERRLFQVGNNENDADASPRNTNKLINPVQVQQQENQPEEPLQQQSQQPSQCSVEGACLQENLSPEVATTSQNESQIVARSIATLKDETGYLNLERTDNDSLCSPVPTSVADSEDDQSSLNSIDEEQLPDDYGCKETTVSCLAEQQDDNNVSSSLAPNEEEELEDDVLLLKGVHVCPVVSAPFRSAQDQEEAIEAEFYETMQCSACQEESHCIVDAKYFACPYCKYITCLDIGTEGDDRCRYGLAMGFTNATILEVQQRVEERKVFRNNLLYKRVK